MNRFTMKLSFVAMVAILSFALAASAMAENSFMHTGQADPTTEGWGVTITNGLVSGGNDGMDYWEINAADPCCYTANGLTDSVAASIISSPTGWSMEATLKVTTPLAEENTAVLTITDNLGDPAAIDFSTRGAWGDSWSINLMTDPGGDPAKTGIWTQGLATGDAMVFLAPVDITAYHTYEMVMTRGATIQEDSVEILVDDTHVASIARTEAYNMQYWRSYVPDGWSKFTWGRTTAGTGVASVSQWAYVEFTENTEVPEPSSLALLAGGMVGLFFCRRRTRC